MKGAFGGGGEAEGVKRWNNGGFISLQLHCGVYCLLSPRPLSLGAAVGDRDKTGLSALQPRRTGLIVNAELDPLPVCAARSPTHWIPRSAGDAMCLQSASAADVHVHYSWTALLSQNSSLCQVMAIFCRFPEAGLSARGLSGLFKGLLYYIYLYLLTYPNLDSDLD